jgi:pyruvate formate-lyase activating enzyme-like uncharacterized protein
VENHDNEDIGTKNNINKLYETSWMFSLPCHFCCRQRRFYSYSSYKNSSKVNLDKLDYHYCISHLVFRHQIQTRITKIKTMIATAPNIIDNSNVIPEYSLVSVSISRYPATPSVVRAEADTI